MKKEIVQGKIVGNERGYAFLVLDDAKKEDYFIPHGDLRGAMHGDTVLCETTDGVGDRTTARVLKVLERGVDRVVGTYWTRKHGGYVIPDDKHYFKDINVPFGKGIRAKAGEKVVCKILSYPQKQNPEGMVIKVFGRQFDKNAEIKSIAYTYKLPEKFNKNVIWEADEVCLPITEKDIKTRKDLRNTLTFTIDGEDARDFDDAVSLELLKNGNYLLGVHIADVTHYVKKDGKIDNEAFSRGTSVYFPEQVIPMLPEKLCNDVCSLVEGKDRLTLSCIMEIDGKGKILSSEITPSVIKSSSRLTYNQVQKMLDGDKQEIEKHSHVYDTVIKMDRLCDILTEELEKQGSIDLDVKESEIRVNEKGDIEIKASKGDKAHKIIEQFMICANIAVAEYLFYLEKPCIYRIHGKPESAKVENFYKFLDGLGVNYKRKKDELFSKDFQTILKNSQGKPYFPLVNRIMLRSMQKAKYSPDNIGHFGLSLKNYCHFTSPIRRYPDLVVHRIIKDFLAGKNVDEEYKEFVYSASMQSSEKEKNAENAERAVDDYYKLMYISGKIGCEYNGIISGVMKFGIFVELENGIEGLCKVETLRGNRYVYDSERYTLSNGKYSYKLGDSVKIKVLGINLTDKKAEFGLII